MIGLKGTPEEIKAALRAYDAILEPMTCDEEKEDCYSPCEGA